MYNATRNVKKNSKIRIWIWFPRICYSTCIRQALLPLSPRKAASWNMIRLRVHYFITMVGTPWWYNSLLFVGVDKLVWCHRLSFTLHQGCSLGLERLGLETVSRRIFGTSRLGLEGWTSRSREFWKIKHLGLVSVLRVQHFGLEDITSWSQSRDFRLVNIHAMHQAWGYITKKIMDMTRKKQVVKWQTSPAGVLNCDTAVLIRFLDRLSLESLNKKLSYRKETVRLRIILKSGSYTKAI